MASSGASTTSGGSPARILVVFGTRPEAIKLAPLVLALRAAGGFEPVVAVTGQHRALLDQVLDAFAIRPDHDLDLFSPGLSLTGITAAALEGLTAVLEAERPDLVVVQGDTTTTVAGALAAFYARVPVVHVEAGLRTGDLAAPWPEEMNRRLVGQLAALHLAPTAAARAALEREGVDPGRIVVTGNTVIDALRALLDRDAPPRAPWLAEVESDPRRLLLVTAHRRESWGAPMAEVGAALADLASAEPDLLVVVPVHPNPIVRSALAGPVAGCAGIRLVEPLGYPDFTRLLHRSTLVLTDSGGVQEEAPSLGKPVLVLREVTERAEAVAAGTARLVGTDRATIVREVRALLRDPVAYERMATAVNPYGDGQATRRTVEALDWLLERGARPDEFVPAVYAAQP